MSSSMVKGILIRPTPDVCNNYSIRNNKCEIIVAETVRSASSRVQWQDKKLSNSSNYSKKRLMMLNWKPRRRYELRPPIRGQVILTPPTTPTTNKVLIISFHSSFHFVFINAI